MKQIHKAIENIKEELEGAKDYAEKYIDSKARGNMQRAEKYLEMAKDELKHAGYLRDMALQDLEGIKKVYELPDELEEVWEHEHKRVLECMAVVKHMLSM